MTPIRVAYWTVAIGCLFLFPPAIPAVIVVGVIAMIAKGGQGDSGGGS